MARTPLIETVRARILEEFQGWQDFYSGDAQLMPGESEAETQVEVTGPLQSFVHLFPHKHNRTTLQRIIEDIEGRDILDVMTSYRAVDLANKYHLDQATIIHWRERLGSIKEEKAEEQAS